MLMVVRPLYWWGWFLAGCVLFPTQVWVSRAATYTVTNASDNVPAPAGSMRQAILDANANPGNDAVVFDIPGTGPFSINLMSGLPSLTGPVTIDGTTQPGYAGKPQIELNGTSATDNGTGLYLLAPNCIIKGLAINRFVREGIRIETFGSNTIQANFIGTGPFGTNTLGNGNSASGYGGITILSGGNLIGGSDPTNRNVISGSNRWGIYLLNASASGNRIQGNHIGVDVTGTNRLGNANDGITLLSAVANVIGPDNVISGNGQSGVYLDSGSTANWVQGNKIGTDPAGARAISNVTDGVTILGGIANLIGGTNATARNIISGNGGRGVMIVANGGTSNLIQGNHIGTDVQGSAKIANGFGGVEIANASSNTIGGTIIGAGNLISGNSLSGVSITGSNAVANVVQGNLLGTDATGAYSLGNARNGVFISGVSGNLIGGTNAGARNIISGNTQNGIQIVDYRARSNSIQGNFIGTDATGTLSAGNGLSGVRIESPANTLGGTNASMRNIISGNANNGAVRLDLSSASNNVIAGNFIGTDVTGLMALPNSTLGIFITNAPRNLVGGTLAGARNLISGNSRNGIYIAGVGAYSNVIQGNYIGTDLTGTQALPNGIALDPPGVAVAGGVDIDRAPSNLIGGTEPGAGNLISGNYRDGLTVGAVGATNNVIQGNLIGTQADGASPLGNETHNVDIRTPGGANNTLIGGITPAAGNTVAYTLSAGPGYDGIRIRDGNTGVLIRGNSTFGNALSATALGIDLGNNGINGNDSCDGDAGANLSQNFPVLTNALSAGVATRIEGSLNSSANGTFLLQFYANTAKAVSDCGEGRTYLGSTNVTTDGSCRANFNVVLPVGVPAGQFISSTASDANNNTSEFGTNVTVTLALLPTINTQPQSQAVPFGSNVTFSVSADGTAPLNYQWRLNGTNLTSATATALSLVSVQPTNAGNYTVTVSNPFGSTNSSPATLTVQFDAPSLGILPGGTGQVIISWPTNGPSFKLQETTNLTSSIIWTSATNVAVVANGKYVVTITAAAGNRFYRLALP